MTLYDMEIKHLIDVRNPGILFQILLEFPTKYKQLMDTLTTLKGIRPSR
jgi:hypothetical protein